MPRSRGQQLPLPVAAFNAGGTSAPVTLATAVTIQAIPPAPPSFKVAAARANGNNDTGDAHLDVAGHRSTHAQSDQLHDPACNNLGFTTGLTSFTATGTATTLTQTVNRNTVYYYRIRANNKRRRFVPLDERAAVPDSHAVTGIRQSPKGREQSLPLLHSLVLPRIEYDDARKIHNRFFHWQPASSLPGILPTA